jgi:hypothetical protein
VTSRRTNETVDVGWTRFVEAGLTYRQLDHWTRSGRLRAVDGLGGVGQKRRWPLAELQVARAMAALVEAGLTVSAAERVARGEYEIAPGVFVLLASLPSGTARATAIEQLGTEQRRLIQEGLLPE